MWAHSNKKSIISIWRSLKYKMVAALHSSVVPGSVPAFQLPYVSSLHRQMALCLHWRPRLLATGSLFLSSSCGGGSASVCLWRAGVIQCLDPEFISHTRWLGLFKVCQSLAGALVSVWANNNITYSWLPSSPVVDRWICWQELQRKTHTEGIYTLDYNCILLFLVLIWPSALAKRDVKQYTSCLAIPSARLLNREKLIKSCQY